MVCRLLLEDADPELVGIIVLSNMRDHLLMSRGLMLGIQAHHIATSISTTDQAAVGYTESLNVTQYVRHSLRTKIAGVELV